MPQNRIQFQPGMSLSELIERFGTEAQCEAALEQARWPSGFICPECGEHKHSVFLVNGQRVWQCVHCRQQTTLYSGTLFHATKLPLTKWFQAIYLLSQDKTDHSALSLKRYLGVCYRTAWRLKHKILEAMGERDDNRQLSGVVIADDAYLGGVHEGKPGRGSENKAPFIAAVQCSDEGHPLYMRLDALPDLKGTSVEQWARKALHPTAHLVTDALASLDAASAVVTEYTAITVSPRKSSELGVFQWVNTIIGNFKTAVRGTYHHINVHKYLARYLAEAQYRLNRRYELHALVDRLLHACVSTAPCPEKWLRLAETRSS